MSKAEVAWVIPAPDDRGDPRSTERLIVRVLLGVGAGVLWMFGLVIMFLNTFGDCFDTEAVCEAVWVLATQRAQAMLAIVVVLTVLAFLAFIWVRPLTLGVLLVATVAVGGVAFVGAQAEPYTIPYFPGGLELIAPALVILIVACVVGIVAIRQPRPAAAA